MASLTQIAITTRKIIRYSIYGIIALIIGRILFGIGKSVYLTLFPPAPPEPTVAFDKLPSLPFPEEKAREKISYRLETTEGGLPTLPIQVKVYFMPQLSANLLALETAQQKAASLGFAGTQEGVSQTTYQFNSAKTPASLEMNIATGAFSISYNLAQDSSPLERRPPAPEVATSNTKSVLSSANLLPEDLAGPTTHQFFRVEAGALKETISLSEANLIKINLFRTSYDDLPSLTQNPTQANVWFMVTGATNKEKQIISGEYHYFPVDPDQNSTYPIKTAQQAMDELSAGGGFIASSGSTQEQVIREVYLAYYDPGEQVEFFQPVVVFEGDDDFVAYVPAVTTDYYGD